MSFLFFFGWGGGGGGGQSVGTLQAKSPALNFKAYSRLLLAVR